MPRLSVNHLLGIKDLLPADIELIFATADNFKEVLNRPIKKVPSLRDVTIANLFFENSTRTRMSFELAERRLSADSNIFCLQKTGAEVMVCGPTTLMPKYISSLGVKVEHDLRKALEWCDIANMLRIQLERQEIKYFPSLREYMMLYGINKAMLDSLE